MQRRVHPTFGKRLTRTSFMLGCTALACLGLGLLAERIGLVDGLEQFGYVAFLVCAAALPLHAAWASERQRCPRCDGRMLEDAYRSPNQELWFACPACEIEWHTRTVVDA